MQKKTCRSLWCWYFRDAVERGTCLLTWIHQQFCFFLCLITGIFFASLPDNQQKPSSVLASCWFLLLSALTGAKPAGEGLSGWTWRCAEERLARLWSNQKRFVSIGLVLIPFSYARRGSAHARNQILLPGAVALQLSNAARMSYNQFSSAAIIKPVLFFLWRHISQISSSLK